MEKNCIFNYSLEYIISLLIEILVIKKFDWSEEWKTDVSITEKHSCIFSILLWMVNSNRYINFTHVTIAFQWRIGRAAFPYI